MGEDNKLLLVFKTLLEKYNSLVEEGYVLDTKVKLIKRGEEEKEVLIECYERNNSGDGGFIVKDNDIDRAYSTCIEKIFDRINLYRLGELKKVTK